VTNVVDIEKRKVVWNHNGRGKSTLDAFFKALGKDKSLAQLFANHYQKAIFCTFFTP
jgi:hypothetical protein